MNASSNRPRRSYNAQLATATETRNVVVLAGPGETAFDESDIRKTVDALKKNRANVILVGDGKRPIAMDEISSALDQARKNGLPTTILADMHGDVQGGKHVLSSDGSYSLTSERLFQSVSKSFGNRPVDVFMTSCYGGQAADVSGALPHGSNLATLAPGSAEVQGHDITNFVNRLGDSSHHDLSARGMLNLYLSHGMENRISPSMAVAGAGNHDLRGALLAHLGKPFSKGEKEAIYKQLGPYMPREQIDTTLKKISSAKSEWDLSAKEYGPSLATMFATSKPSDRSVTPDYDTSRLRGTDGTIKLPSFDTKPSPFSSPGNGWIRP